MPSFAKSLSLHLDIQPFAEYAVTPFVGVWIETLCNVDYVTPSGSHPSWVCGLKLLHTYTIHFRNDVTPFVGVWIETVEHISRASPNLVTPFVGVWIETSRKRHKEEAHQVTPFVGVWIETNRIVYKFYPVRVTPFVGVWIETTRITSLEGGSACHTLRGCVD